MALRSMLQRVSTSAFIAASFAAKNRLSHYPVFNPPHLARYSRWRHENCLAYALNHRLEGPDLFEMVNRYGSLYNKSKQEILEYVAKTLNQYYKDNTLTIIATPAPGQLPAVKKNYYPIALTISDEKDGRPDYHVLVQTMDGTWAHRRGEQRHPERHDANNQLIVNPEKARLYYKSGMVCYNYQFIGYLYVKIPALRPSNMQEIKKPPVSQALFAETKPNWEQRGNFSLGKRENGIPLNRSLEFINNNSLKKITSIKFLGYKDNKLRLCVAFEDIDFCNDFLNLCSKRLLDSTELSVNEEKFWFDPDSYKSLEEVLRRLHEFDPLMDTQLHLLPALLNTRPDESAGEYPEFDANFKGYRGYLTADNCLSYALNQYNQGVNNFPHFELKNQNKAMLLQNAACEINQWFKDENFVLPAPQPSPGEVPLSRAGYYTIAFTISQEKEPGDGMPYQMDDFHFLVRHSNGLWSHRSGGHAPEQKDSDGNLISNPEKAKLFYTLRQSDGYSQDCCLNYQFIGYLYVKSVPNRLQYPRECYRQLAEIVSNGKDSELKKQYFLYPPLPEFFPEVRAEIAEYHKAMKKDLQSQLNNHPVRASFLKASL